MQRGGRLIFAAAVIVVAPLMSACSDMVDKFETLELFDTKKKLSGERKPVFPEGVPGATSGVPAELVKGYQQPESGPVDPAKAAAEAAAADHAKPTKPKPQPKPQQTAAKPPPQRTAAKPPATSADANASPAPGAAPAAPPAAGGPPAWPAQQPQAAAQPQANWPGGAPATR
jgi:hypothetical protein